MSEFPLCAPSHSSLQRRSSKRTHALTHTHTRPASHAPFVLLSVNGIGPFYKAEACQLMYESRNGDSFLRVDDDCVPVLKSDSLLPNDITISFWFQFPAYDFLLSEFARLSSTHTHTRTHTHPRTHTRALTYTSIDTWLVPTCICCSVWRTRAGDQGRQPRAECELFLTSATTCIIPCSFLSMDTVNTDANTHKQAQTLVHLHAHVFCLPSAVYHCVWWAAAAYV